MARRIWFIRDELLMLVGLGLGGFGGLALLGFALSDKSDDKGMVGGLIFTFTLLIGGAVTFWIGLRFRRMEQQLRAILGAMRMVDQTTIRSLAAMVSLPEEETRKGALYLISHAYLPMRFDPGRDMLLSPRAASNQVAWLRLPGNCPNCHAPGPTVAPATEKPRCEYCGRSIPCEPLTPEAATHIGEDAPPVERAMDLGRGVFSGSWPVLVLLMIFCWPVGLVYLMRGLRKHGGMTVVRR